MSKYNGTPELEAMRDEWYANEADTRAEPIITYDTDYPAIALYIDMQDESGMWVQVDNDLWEDEVREWHEKDRYERTAERMWRE